MAADTSTQSLFGRLSSARSSFVSHKELKISIQLLDDNETITHEFKVRVFLSSSLIPLWSYRLPPRGSPSERTPSLFPFPMFPSPS